MPEDKAERLRAIMEREFPEAEVTGYEHLIAAMKNHEKDRHVAAAAVKASAQARSRACGLHRRRGHGRGRLRARGRGGPLRAGDRCRGCGVRRDGDRARGAQERGHRRRHRDPHGIKNRMEFFRCALGHYLTHLGATDAAAMFAAGAA